MEALLQSASFRGLLGAHSRERVVVALRACMEDVRRDLGAEEPDGPDVDLTSPEGWAERAAAWLEAEDVPSLRPVVNATGVVLHTNLGRAPLAAAARKAMTRAATGYGNLEFDLATGRRGSRYDHCAALLRELTGAEGALVVNNAAAALVLALNTVARGRGVAVSRGELVEIGGGFRIPEILERSGARLVEVGSTNRTRVADYARALEEEDVAALLKVHRSNFRISGFTEEAPVEALSELSRQAGLPLLYDLGSGLFAEAGALGLPPEPRAHEGLAGGADLVVVSGDKLLGGPQAGLVVGREALVEALKGNPLCRALRVDKVTLAGLEATLRLYREPERALEEIPTLRMLRASPEALRERAVAMAAALAASGAVAEALPHDGAVGGGTYPEARLSSWAVALDHPGGGQALAAALREGTPPVVGRIDDERVYLDLRTVDPEEDALVVRRVVEAWKGATP